MTPKNRAETIEEARRKALIYTPEFFSCSLGTNLALQDAFGISDASMFKAASGLHGGIGERNDVCGGLLGASLMIGWMFGKSPEERRQSGATAEPGEPDSATRLVGELYDWFGKEFGSVKCSAIQERNRKEVNTDPESAGLTDEEKTMAAFKKCDRLTGETAAKAAEMIYDEMEKEAGEKRG